MQMMTTNRFATLAKTFVFLFALMAASVAPLFALDLDTARAKGLIGEVDDGYIAIPPEAGNEAAALVDEVNVQRRAVYIQIAEKNGISVEATGQRTFEKRYPDFPTGTWVKMKGTWLKK
ncbi:MAG: YdbL family protein [Chlorobiaceae bacterium]|nr:YdbL family protein [Chlorobiaceae bacterium]